MAHPPKQHAFCFPRVFVSRAISLLGIGLLAMGGMSCRLPSEETSRFSPDTTELGTVRSLLRPDHIASRYSYGGAPTQSYPTPGGGFRIWWATSGRHAPLLVDADNNGTPDFVELVAKVADEIEVKAKQAGWRWPKPDNTWISDPKDYGGDERLDVYLYDFDAGDGKFELDACRQVGPVNQCTGYMILQKNFLNSSYASNEEGVRVVLSHEFFHYIQATYVSPLPGWWSEGSATWFEEFFYPAQLDFERLARYYLIEPSRSINDRQRGPSDAFAYGAGLFVYFLAEKLTDKSIEEIFAALAAGSELLQAIKGVATKRQTSLEALFEEFAVRNLFTGSRTVGAKGYPQAKNLALVPVQTQVLTQFNWDLEVSSLAAKYGTLAVTRPLTLRIQPIAGFERVEVYVVTSSEFEKEGHGKRLALDTPLRVEPSNEPLYLVFVNGYTDATRAVRVEVRHAATPNEPTPEPAAETSVEATVDGGIQDLLPETNPTPEPAQESAADTSPPSVGCGCSSTTHAPLDAMVFLVLLCLFSLRRFGRRPTA